MNSELLEKLASAGSIFLVWHLLTLVLCATGLLLERFLRKGSSHVRSALLRLTLALALATPVVCALWEQLPPFAAPALKAQETIQPITSLEPPSVFPQLDWNHVAVWRPMISDLGQLQDHLVMATRSGPFLLQSFYTLFLGASILVSLFLFVRLLSAIFHCVALRRLGKPLESSEEARCRSIASAMGVSTPQVLTVDGLESPLLLGFFKPVILLSLGIRDRDEIYSHELTHLRRHDMWWHLFTRLATMLMPLQPAFWLLRNAMERADEDVCDDMVLLRGADRSAYAELLLNVAESQHSPNPDLCLPMAAFRSQLERRLYRLMDKARPLASRLSLSTMGLCLAPLLVVGLLTGAIYLDAEHPLRAADQPSAQLKTPALTVDYSSFLATAASYDKEALTSGFRAADAWLSNIDAGKYSNTPAPDELNSESISPKAWQDYLINTYSQYGVAQSRQLKTLVPGVNAVANPTISHLLLEYETVFQGQKSPVMLGENLFLDRDANGQWRVAKFLTFTRTEPQPAYSGPTPVIRSINVEFVGLPAIPRKEMESDIIATSGLQIDKPCQVAQLHRAVKKIYSTGKVTNVAIKALPDGGAVNISIVVQPNPTVSQVSFKGFTPEEEAKLLPHLHSKVGAMGSAYLVFEDVKLIESELTKEGVQPRSVRSMLTPLDSYQNTSSVTFTAIP